MSVRLRLRGSLFFGNGGGAGDAGVFRGILEENEIFAMNKNILIGLAVVLVVVLLVVLAIVFRESLFTFTGLGSY